MTDRGKASDRELAERAIVVMKASIDEGMA